MSSLVLTANGEGHIVKRVEAEEPTTRGIVSQANFQQVRDVLGDVVQELIGSVSHIKDETKEMTMELAFELTAGLDLKLVNSKSASTIKLTVKI